MYNVPMGRYTASEARRLLFRLLDAAERGEEVILERRGARFRIELDHPDDVEIPDSPLVVEDPALLDGQWAWTSDEDGNLHLRTRG
jgi:hypothetical protein